jgi:hypothetical protein
MQLRGWKSIDPKPEFRDIENVPGERVNTLGGHSIDYSKQKVYMYTCVLFLVSEIELFHCTVHCTLYRRATRHVLTLVARYIDVDGGILDNVLH